MNGARSHAQKLLHNADLSDEARAFKRGRAPLLVAVLANALLASALLGVPYIRGQQHAAGAIHEFSEFAACLFDGRPQPEPGLALPSGDRVRFGEMAISGASDWPSRCEPALTQVAPPEAIFLWPSVKTAGNDVRRAVDLLRKELVELRAAVGIQQAVPQRPLLILSKLRAALTLMARSAHLSRDLDRSAVSYDTRQGVREPTRLPLVASVAAPTEFWSTAKGLEVLAVDRAGVSWLRLRDGSVARRRVRRTGLVRGVLISQGRPLVVWATRESRCQRTSEGCARKSTGVGLLDFDSNRLSSPHWVRGHPAGPIASHLFMKGDLLSLLSRTEDGTKVKLQSFELDLSRNPEHVQGQPVVPLVSQRSLTLNAGSEIGASMLIDDAGVLLLSEVEGGVSPQLHLANGRGEALPVVRGARPWSQHCQFAGHRAIAYGTDIEVQAIVLGSGIQSVLDSAKRVDFASGEGSEASGVAPVQMNCDRNGFSLVYRDTSRRLWGQRCGYAAPCDAPVLVAARATTYASLLYQGKLAVAYAEKKNGQIRMRVGGVASAAISPCFLPRAGMCGTPTLHQVGSRLVLAAREGADALVLESSDGGRSFQPLPGLADTGFNSGGTDPLRQHRLRKGID